MIALRSIIQATILPCYSRAPRSASAAVPSSQERDCFPTSGRPSPSGPGTTPPWAPARRGSGWRSRTCWGWPVLWHIFQSIIQLFYVSSIYRTLGRAATGRRGFAQTFLRVLQGDTSGCDEPPVDIKTTVLFRPVLAWPGLARPIRNFCYYVKGRFVTTWCVTLYSCTAAALLPGQAKWTFRKMFTKPLLQVAAFSSKIVTTKKRVNILHIGIISALKPDGLRNHDDLNHEIRGWAILK